MSSKYQNRVTIGDLQKVARSKGGKCLEESYLGHRVKHRWQCKEGHTWEATAVHVRRGSWCRVCWESEVRKRITYSVDENGCHVCTSHKMNNGYPVFKRNSKWKYISNWVWEKSFGPIPEGLMIRHKCDNRACINVEHLELGTHQDNMDDMVKRNRQAYGEKHGTSKLTKSQIKKIKEEYSAGRIGMRELGKKEGVSKATIWRVVNKINWRHV